MKTRIALLAISLITVFAATVKAQDTKELLKESTPEQRAKMQTTMMKAKLNLDSAQVTKVQAINLKSAQKLDPILKSDGRKLKMLREVLSIQKEKDADLKAVLSDEQYKRYEKMKDELKQRVMDGRQYNP